jgi:hypothetical protein
MFLIGMFFAANTSMTALHVFSNGAETGVPLRGIGAAGGTGFPHAVIRVAAERHRSVVIVVLEIFISQSW